MNTRHGPEHQSWKGGRLLDKDGYINIWKPGHPYANNVGYVPEHRLVMEECLDVYLKPTLIVHHKNGKRDDNRLENLEVMTIREHKSHHGRGRKHTEETKQKLRKHHNPKSNLNLRPQPKGFKVAPIA